MGKAKLSVCAEGEEADEFWAALGGEGAGTAADWLNSIPGLWQQDHGGSIGFPGRKFGSTFHPERWAERKQGKFGHAAYR